MERCSVFRLSPVVERTYRASWNGWARFHFASTPSSSFTQPRYMGWRRGVLQQQQQQKKKSDGPMKSSVIPQIKASDLKQRPSHHGQKLDRLRQFFFTAGIDAYIIPSADPHQSEMPADCYMRRAFISGFTGSSGTAVVTKEKAALWTDGRYFLQAEQELGPEWQLMRAGLPGVPAIRDWLGDALASGSKVGIDPFLFSCDEAEDLRQGLLEKNHQLVLLYDTNLVDQVWGDLKPSPPSAQLRVHHIDLAGIDVGTKMRNLRNNLVSAGATAIVITMLDEVAWLLNLRGSDIPHSPVTYAYAVVELDIATIFVDESKITPQVSSHLEEAQVSVKPYEALLPELKRLAKAGAKLWLDASCVSMAIATAFADACSTHQDNLYSTIKTSGVATEKNVGPRCIYQTSPITFSKAIKNSAELDGMKQAHLRDAAAMTEFWAWLEKKIVLEGVTLTESMVADELFKYRAKQAGFRNTSFSTICGSGANGAIIHYSPSPEDCADVNSQKLLLIDSGGQYIDGTTDITRTVHFGTPSAWQKECFTRVLQGHIAIDKAIFPEETPGFVLDILARSSLWKIGLDYRHGTGHGVGAALNVHEGPQSISTRYGNTTGLKAGMVISNEPGYYEDRKFGIRIENLLVIREVDTKYRFGGTTYLGFERLTKVPIQTKLMDLQLMTEEEIEWVNCYHQEVWEMVSPLVEGGARKWLRENTMPISRETVK